MAPAPGSPASRRSLGSPLSLERAVGRLSLSSRLSNRKSRPKGFQLAVDDGVDEWGKSASQRETSISALRNALRKQGVTQDVDPHTLLRFLRAREYDIPRTLAMLTAHLKWRQENLVDSVLTDFDFKEREQYMAVYPQGYYNTDKQGRPVSIQHLGQINPKRILQITSEDRMLRYHIQEYERFLHTIAPVCSRVAGRHIDQTMAILDVKGVTISMMTGDVRKFVSRITSIAQDHYPETMAETIIINAPMSFRFVWSAVKPLLQPRTVNKITLLGTHYMDELAKRVDVQNIPSYLGGRCTSTLLEDVGPWSDQRVLERLGPTIDEASTGASMMSDDGSTPDASSYQNKAASELKSASDGAHTPLAVAGATSPLVAAHQGAHMESRASADASDMLLGGPPAGVSGLSHVRASAPGFSGTSDASAHGEQTNLFRRVQSLEDALRGHTGAAPAPVLLGAAAAPTSLLGRVQLLERAMATVVEAQEASLRGVSRSQSTADSSSRGCCACCCIM